MPLNLAFATVPLSGTVSGAFSLKNTEQVAIWSPITTACSLMLLASFDTTSANYLPVHDPRSPTTRLAFGIGAGSKMIVFGNVLWAISAKIQLSAAQTAPRSFAVITR